MYKKPIEHLFPNWAYSRKFIFPAYSNQKFPYNLTSVPIEKSLSPAIREGIKMAKITIVYFRKKWFAKRLYSDNRKRPQEITNVAI